MRMGRTRRLLALGALSIAAVIGTSVIDTAPAMAAENHSRSFLTGDGTSDAYGGPGVVWTGQPAYGPGELDVPGDRAFALGESYLTASDPSAGNFGTGDFTLRFNARFSGRGGPSEQVLSKRATCDGGTFLDVRTRDGLVYAELADPANPHFGVLHPTNVHDGAYHEVVVTRAGSTLSVSVDDVAASDRTDGVVDLDNAAPLRLGDGPCVTRSGRAGDGTTRAAVLLDDVSFGPGTTPTERPLLPGVPLAAPVLVAPPVPTGPEAADALTDHVPSGTVPSNRLPSGTVPSDTVPSVTDLVTPRDGTPAGHGEDPADASTGQRSAHEPQDRANVADLPSGPVPVASTVTDAAAVAGPQPQEAASTPVVAVASGQAEPPAGRTAIDLAAALPDPSDVRSDLPSVLSSILLALVLFGMLMLPVQPVNRAATANAERITRAFTGLRLAALARRYRQLPPPVAMALATAPTALGYVLLQPVLGLGTSSLALALGFAVAFAVVTKVAELSRQVHLGRQRTDRGLLHRLPGFLLLGLASMLVARLVGLQTGLIVGALATTVVTAASARADVGGRAKAVSAASLVTLGALAWMLRETLTEFGRTDGSFGAEFVGAALTAVTVAAVVHLAFAMIPVVFLDGAAVRAWSKPRWALFAGLGAFTFVHVLVQPVSGSQEMLLIGLLAAYLLAAAAFCVLFRAPREPRTGQLPEVTHS